MLFNGLLRVTDARIGTDESVMPSVDNKRPLKVFLCHIMPAGYAHADRDPVRGLPEGTRLTKDGVDRYAWFDKAKPCGERSRTILPGQDWELEIRKAV
jgi:hypothetical protein